MLSDLRHGVRMLIKNPGFTVIAILSIAIGVGANAAMFSVARRTRHPAAAGTSSRRGHDHQRGIAGGWSQLRAVASRVSRSARPDAQLQRSGRLSTGREDVHHSPPTSRHSAAPAWPSVATTSRRCKGPGFRTDHLLTVTFEPGLARYDDARTRVFYRQVKESAQALPGVTSVSLASAAPMKTGDIRNVQVAPEGFPFREGTENVAIPSIDIDDRYFATTGIPIVHGRAFTRTDTSDSPRVALVNQTFAAHYWPGQNPVGKRIRLDSAGRTFAEVVGVAQTVAALTAVVMLAAYLPARRAARIDPLQALKTD